MKSKTLLAAMFAASLAFGGTALAQESKPAAQPEQKDAHKEHKDNKEMKREKAKVGETAPEFKLTDTAGKEVKLSDYKGKIVVLEWFNPGCPVVQEMYKKGTMGKLHAEFKDKGVVFLAINSSGTGMEGAGTEANATAKKNWKIEYPILLDESGHVGHSYGATNTPNMFVINKDGKLVYRGAIDDQKDKNYVQAALNDVLAGKPVATAETKPYGCGIKYGTGSEGKKDHKKEEKPKGN